MRKIHLWGALLVSLIWGITATVPAHAMTTVDQHAAALAAPGKLRPLDDTQVHFVTVPSSYAQAANLHGTNTIASDQGSAVTFTTNTFYPRQAIKGSLG